MRDGHYTAGDIEELTIVPADKKKGTCRSAWGTVDGLTIWSSGWNVILKRGNDIIFDQGFKSNEAIPPKYRVVAEIIRKKANGRGGRRLRAGAKKGDGPQKKTYSFKLTAYESIKVKEYIEKLRIEEQERKESLESLSD